MNEMKGFFNLSRRLRNILFISISFFFVFGVSLSICFGQWLFDNSVSNTDEINSSFNADPIRENTILNDGRDVYDAGTQYYDVYFMAQAVSYKTFLTEVGQIDGKSNYQFNASRSPTYYDVSSTDSSTLKYAMSYGTFKEEGSTKGNLGALLTDDINQDFNRYFKRFRNVAELSTEQMDELGNPECFLFDSQSTDNSWSGMWRLSFLCWTPAIDEVSNLYYNGRNSSWRGSPDYFQMSTSAPTSGDKTENSNYETYSNFFPSDYDYGITNFGQVTGWYPEDNSSFTTFYTNTVLSNYDSRAIYINGRKSIFVYPVYTVGKNYVNTDNAVDSITIGEYTSSGDFINSEHLAYDGALTSMLRSSLKANTTSLSSSGDTRYSVYAHNNVVFDASLINVNDPNRNRLIIRNDVDRVNGSWSGENHLIQNQSEFDLYSVGTGRFNIYIVVKEGYRHDSPTSIITRPDRPSDPAFNSFSEITSDEESAIIKAFRDNGYGQYAHINGENQRYLSYEITYDVWYYTHHFYSDYRDYLIYFERVYDSRLVAGPTAMVDYESQASIDATFTRRGNATSLLDRYSKDRYRLRNVRLNSETLIHYDLPNYTYTDSNGNEHTYRLTFPGNYFGVMVLPEYDFEYTYTIPNDDTDISEDATAKYYTNSSLGITNAVLPEMEIGGVLNYEFRGSTYFSKADTADLSENGVIYIEEMVDGNLQSTRYTLSNFTANGKTFNPESFVLIKARQDGNYTIEAWMQYTQNTSGRTVLSNIIFWGYRFNKLFINIMQDASDIEFGYVGYDTDPDLSNNAFINTEIFAYRKDSYEDGSYVSLNDEFYVGQSSNVTSLSALLDTCDLEDYVTGKVYTKDTIGSLYMDRNYVLIMVNKR